MVERFMYVVSPEYLMPIVEQSKDYSFKVKGFSDCTRAYNNLAGTNQANILGYILVYEEVPDNSTDLVEFINFVNLIGTKDTIVLVAFRDTDGFEQLMDFLELDNITFKNTICSATKTRQQAAKELSVDVDCMIVIGGKHSSNTQKLVNICKEQVPTFAIETKEDLDIDKLNKFNLIGVTAGASTPDWIIEDVISFIESL